MMFKKNRNKNAEAVDVMRNVMADRGAAINLADLCFDYLSMCYEVESGEGVLMGHIQAYKTIMKVDEIEAFCFILNLLKDNDNQVHADMAFVLCRDREDLMGMFLERFTGRANAYIMEAFYEDEDEFEDACDCCEKEECDGCEGELTAVAFNFTLGGVNFDGVISMDEDGDGDD